MSEPNKQETAKGQEPVVIANDVTKNILNKYGVNSVTQDEIDNREENAGDAGNSAVVDNEQVVDGNDELIDITDAELEALAKADVTEEDLNDLTLEEIKAKASDLINATGDTKVTQEPEKVVISDQYAEQLAQQYPFAKSLKGKTLEEVMEIIQNQNSYITTLEKNKEKAEPDATDDTDNNSQLTKTNGKVTAQDVIKLFDPTRDPEEVAEELNKLLGNRSVDQSTIDKLVEDKLRAVLPNLQGLQQASLEQEKKDFFTALGKQLPEGSNPEQVFEQWKKDNANLSKEEKLALVNNPKLMMKIIAQEHNLKTTSTEKKKIEDGKNKEIKTKTYDNLKKLLKSGRNTSTARFNFPRESSTTQANETEEETPAEQMIGKIVDKYISR